MLDGGCFAPSPAFVSPEGAMVVAARLYEAEKFGVGHVVAFYSKCGNAGDAFAALVVPSEGFRVGFVKAQCCIAFGNFDEIALQMFGLSSQWRVSPDLAVVRHAMEQVRECFRVHQAMLDGGLEHFQ